MCIYNELKNELLKEIRKDEYEYCYDRCYCPDEDWKNNFPSMSRKTAFLKSMQYCHSLSIEGILKDFGDKYYFVFEKFGLNVHDYI